MNTLRQVVRAFELVVLDKYPDLTAPDPVRGTAPASAESKDKKTIHQEMVLMDRRVLALLKDAEKRGLVEVRKGMGGEAELARNFALSTRMMLSVIEIVLHRSAAFPEVAIFSKRMYCLSLRSVFRLCAHQSSRSSSRCLRHVRHACYRQGAPSVRHGRATDRGPPDGCLAEPLFNDRGATGEGARSTVELSTQACQAVVRQRSIVVLLDLRWAACDPGPAAPIEFVLPALGAPSH